MFHSATLLTGLRRSCNESVSQLLQWTLQFRNGLHIGHILRLHDHQHACIRNGFIIDLVCCPGGEAIPRLTPILAVISQWSPMIIPTLLLRLVNQRVHIKRRSLHSLQMIKLGIQKVHLIRPTKHQLIVTNVKHILDIQLNASIKYPTQPLKISKIVLHHDPCWTQQQLHCTKHIQSFGHSHTHDSLGQIQQHQIKCTKVLSWQQCQALCTIAKPPLNPFIIKMRLCLEVLKRITCHNLIQFQPQYHLQRWIFEHLM
mmetsp:Transcript_25839/g.37986  ORF Transcript_25839/g.37986 Transcript_25839/m.37986 type:complete len:257 (+) Transcript_25839:394-1164(+)